MEGKSRVDTRPARRAQRLCDEVFVARRSARDASKFCCLRRQSLNDDIQHRRPEEHVIDAFCDGLVHCLDEAVSRKGGTGGGCFG